MWLKNQRQTHLGEDEWQKRCNCWDGAFKSVIILQIMLLLSDTSSGYTSHYHQHNFSCVDWKQTPEATAGNCSRYGRYAALRCYGGLNNLASISEQKLRRLEDVIFCGWPSTSFNPITELQHFPRLRLLIIEYSGLREIASDFPEMLNLQYINISWTNLSHINTRTFKHIYTLKVLDLRWNRLVHLDGPLMLPRFFEHLYLAGNPWNCLRNFKWLLKPERGGIVADRGDLICTDRKFKDRHIMTVMNYRLILKKECQSHDELKNCTCVMHHIIPKSHIPLYTVNCSSLQLLRLPSYLPENTSTFYANDNLISDVLPLQNNIHYRHVVDVYLDSNRIESIDVLEAGYWLENFRLLSLRGNKLRKVPVYALDNALEDNANANLLLLSGNPWYCSCKFAMRFRDFLMKYNSILRDARNVTCTYGHDDEIREANVLSITRTDVCKPDEETQIYPLDLLNGVLVSAIVFILGKLAYDYYYYKHYGRVPWIVMKLP